MSMSSSLSDNGVEPNTSAKNYSTILSRAQQLRFGDIHWTPDNSGGFSSVLVDEEIISGLPVPLLPPKVALQSCYRVSKAPSKGLGMFATKDINPGDRILVEHPLLVVPKQIMSDFPLPLSIIYNVLVAVYRDAPAFDAFFSLANSHPSPEDSLPFDDFITEATNILGANITRVPEPFACNVSVAHEDAPIADVKDAKAIAETNALDIQITDPKWNADVALTHRAVFLNASRINHSCSPNASYSFDYESWALSVFADRAIRTDEEMTFSYTSVNLLDPRSLRLKTLKSTHGFHCVCETCNKPNEPKALAESDKRREELKNWMKTAPIMWKWFSDFSLKDDYMLLPHIRALFLMQKEGLYLQERKGHLVAVADTYAALGERTKYIQWAKKVLEYHKSKNEVYYVQELEPFIANPESHPQWRLRIRAKEGSRSGQKKRALPAENGHISYAPTPSGPCGTVTQEDVERWLADTNWTSTDLWSVGQNHQQASRKYISRNIYVDANFDCTTVLDSVTLSLIPIPPFKPYPRSAPKLEDAIKICPTSNKGLAMFAKQNFESGGMILVESPTLVCPIIAPPVHQHLFDRLGPEQRKAALSLANNKPPEVCNKYEGIIRTNCIQINLPIEDGQPEVSAYHAGVFLNISRCNHSCRPNAGWQWDLASWSMGLTATRSIRAGEEITVAYINNSEPREARRKKLFKMYRFECECERCHPRG